MGGITEMYSDIKDLEQRVYDVLTEAMKIKIRPEDYSVETKLLDLGFNSISFVRLGVLLEEEFDIRFLLKELNFNNNSFQSIQSLIDTIQQKMKKCNR